MAESNVSRRAAKRAMASHQRTFRALEAVAENRLARGALDEAAAYTQIAADYAWHNHPGVFASPRLERVLWELGRATAPAAERAPRTSTPRPTRILHVLTEAYALGGHTRLTRRWIGLDEGRAHSVVLTRQPRGAVPADLEEAVSLRRGSVGVLDTAGGLLDRARRLRALAADFDAVVINTHPYDVVPVIALAARRDGPAAVVVNHADHVFWLGVGVGDAVACIRGSGLALAQCRRALDPSRCVLLPVPLDLPRRVHTRATAKAALGLPEDMAVLLTVAQAYKYRPADGLGFLDLMTPVVEAYPGVVLIAVGPDARGTWRLAGDRTGGRLRAVGPVADPTVFYEAADVYVDSYPIASLTSLLEAASFGVPIISLRSPEGDTALLAADDPGIAEHLVVAATPAGLRASLERLLSDSRDRDALGRQTAAAVARVHAGDGWRRTVDETFARALTLGPAAAPPVAEDPPPGELDELVYLIQSHPAWSARLGQLVHAHIGLLPPGARPWGTVGLSRAVALLPGVFTTRSSTLERRLFLRPRLATAPARRDLPARPEWSPDELAPNGGR